MKLVVLSLALLLVSPAPSAFAGELYGSRAALAKAHRVAKKNNYTFARSSRDVRALVKKEKLERVSSNAHVLVNKVSFPYARPAVKVFVERLGEQYFAATGERLVITSLTRPLSRQPRNASALSVHPAGMAVDLRIPKNAAHRRWLENTLLSLEDEVVLDVTKERNPAHYHVAVFPRQYEAYVARLTAD